MALSIRRGMPQVQFLAQQFWIRWRTQYLPALQMRQKWTKEHRNVAVGDVVLLLDKDAPRAHWPLGRVVEVFRNSDNFVRRVAVKTERSVLVRPIHKLVLVSPNSDLE